MAKLPIFKESPEVLVTTATAFLKANPKATRAELRDHVAANTKDDERAWNLRYKWYRNAAATLGYVPNNSHDAARGWIVTTPAEQIQAQYREIFTYLEKQPEVLLLRAEIKRHKIQANRAKPKSELSAAKSAASAKDGEVVKMTPALREVFRYSVRSLDGLLSQLDRLEERLAIEIEALEQQRADTDEDA